MDQFPFFLKCHKMLVAISVCCHTASGPNVKLRPLCHASHPRPNQSKWYSTPHFLQYPTQVRFLFALATLIRSSLVDLDLSSENNSGAHISLFNTGHWQMLRRSSCRCREKLHCQQTIVLSSPLVFRPKQLKHFPVDQNNHVILVIKVRRYRNQFYRSSRVLVLRRSSNSSSSLGMGPTFPQCQSNFATEPFIVHRSV